MTETQVVTRQVMSGGQNLAMNPVGTRDWSSGTFDCFNDWKSCLCASFCPLCFAVQLARRLDESCCVPLCVGILPLRVKARLMLGIKGDICNDTYMMFCCGRCVMCQLSRELDAVGWHE